MPDQKLMESLEREIKEFPRKLLRAQEVLLTNPEYQVAGTPADIVYAEDKVRLLHYHRLADKKKHHATPVLIVYALINRYIMLDL